MIKLIASDMDGTLLNNEHKIPEKNVELIKLAVEDATPPAWLELDRAAFSGKVLQNPTKDDLDFDLNESLIVEFYSR